MILARVSAEQLSQKHQAKLKLQLVCLDDEILAWFREQVHLAGGGNYQALINDALREYIQQHHEPLGETWNLTFRERL
ncbi:BrnA antitoxin family protein [Nostoc sp. CENA543]|uniref:BrnA antitoxin family protein n=1 Tax=Nostoc sp. CENA543 TaxID=1869241 RepID=UPI001CEF7AF3